MTKHDAHITLMPSSAWELMLAAVVFSFVAWWCLGLDDWCWTKLLVQLLGTAFLASAFGPHPDAQAWARREYPKRLGYFLWRLTRSGNTPTVYYPLPFYTGLVMLAVAAVLAVVPAR